MVAIIALLAAIAVPSFLRARLRGQASTVLNELRLIDAAKDQYMIENNRSELATFTAGMLVPYLKQGSSLYNAVVIGAGGGTADRLGGDATITYAGSSVLPSVQVPQAMLDVASSATFWSPYSATPN